MQRTDLETYRGGDSDLISPAHDTCWEGKEDECRARNFLRVARHTWMVSKHVFQCREQICKLIEVATVI